MPEIAAEKFYPEADIILQFGLSFNDLARARKDGLQFKELRRGKRVYKGEWLLTWLSQPEVQS
jgi:hypothetical protein